MILSLGKYRLNFDMFVYLIFYLGLMHALTLGNVFLAGAQINTLVIDIVAVYSVAFALVYIGKRICTPRLRVSLLDFLVCLFLTYSLLSVVLFLQPSNPASINSFFYGIHLLILPVFLYFTVAKISEKDQRRLLLYLCSLHIILVVIGILLFVWRPDFYTEYLRERLASRGAEEMWQLYARLYSYMGSTSTGMLSALTIAMLPMVRLRPLVKYILLVLLLFAVLITQQRGAYISATVATLFFLFLDKFNFKSLLVILAFCSLVLFSLNLSTNENIASTIEYTSNRITDDFLDGNVFDERASSYAKGLDLWSQFPLGMGLGATTSAADTGGANPGGQVVDANYIRILCDLGPIGLLIFLCLILAGVRAVYVNDKKKYYLAILFIYSFQATGTNVFDIFYVNHLFWVYLGLINANSEKHAVQSHSRDNLEAGL